MSSPVHRKRHWYSPKSTAHSVAVRPRLYFSALAGIGVLALLPRGWSASIREAVAWDLSATIYLILAFRVMLTCKGDLIRAHAARQDDSRAVILVIILLAIGASFVATGGLLAEAKDAPHRTLNLGLAAASVDGHPGGLHASLRTRILSSERWPAGLCRRARFSGRSKPGLLGFLLFRDLIWGSITDVRCVDPDQTSAPAGDAALNHLVLLQHGRARAGHQSRGLDDLRGQVGGVAMARLYDLPDRHLWILGGRQQGRG